jgi:WXG100 family type VII secretion target
MQGRKRITSDTAAVHACLERIDEELVEIGRDLTRLDQAASHLSTRWSGEAQRAYDQAHRETMHEYAELVGVARRLAAISKRATTELAQADHDLAQVWR